MTLRTRHTTILAQFNLSEVTEICVTVKCMLIVVVQGGEYHGDQLSLCNNLLPMTESLKRAMLFGNFFFFFFFCRSRIEFLVEVAILD